MGAAALAAGGLTAGAGVYSAYQAGQAGRMQGRYYGYMADTARTNAGLADAQSVSERRGINARALSEQVALTDKINETVGAQRAAVVTGVGAGSRSAQMIIKDTINKGELDEIALRTSVDLKSRNAEVAAKMGAINYMNEAGGDELAGINSRAAGRAGSTTSLLGAAGSVANSWYLGNLYSGGYRPRTEMA